MAITVSVLTGGTNDAETTAAEINAPVTDLFSEGVVDTITLNAGSGGTGGFSVNAQGTPNMTVAVGSGVCYVEGTPTSGSSQTVRVANSASSNVTVAANSTGSTVYDWLYIKLDPDKMANPAATKDDVASLVISRSTSSATDNGTPPTYGYLLAKITVANAAASITNANISDQRSQLGYTSGLNDSNGNEIVKPASVASAVNEVTVTNAATGNAPSVAATGGDTNISLNLASKGTGEVQLNGTAMSGAWTSWTPTWTGFSANPTTKAYYKQIGKTVVAVVRCTAPGTSNATSTTITNAPVTAKTDTGFIWFAAANIQDNGSPGTAPGRAYIQSNSATVTIGPNWSSDTWVASGSKAADFTLIYEAA